MTEPARAEARAGLDAVTARYAEPIFWGLTLLVALPFWSSDLLALTDWPHHLASAQSILDFDDPTRRLADSYRLDLVPRSYLGPTYLLVALGAILPIQVAGQVVLTAYAVALCLAARALVRAAGRDPRLAWFAPLFVHQWALAYGFLPYVLSIPPALYAVARARRLLDGPTAGRIAGLGAVYAVSALMHPLGVLLAATASVGLLLAARAGRRIWLAHLGIWSAVGVWGLLAALRVPRAGAVFQDLGITTGWRWTIKHRLVDFALAYLPGNLDYLTAAAGCAALVGAIALGRARKTAGADPLEGAALAVALLYLVAPVNLAVFSLRMSLLSPRLIVPLWLFALPLARGRAPRLALVGALAALGHAGLLAKTHAGFGADWSGPVAAALAEIPRGSRVEPQVVRPARSALNVSTVRPPEVALHAYSMLVAGFDPKLFSTPQAPLHVLAGRDRPPDVRWVQTSTTIRIERVRR